MWKSFDGKQGPRCHLASAAWPKLKARFLQPRVTDRVVSPEQSDQHSHGKKDNEKSVQQSVKSARERTTKQGL